MEIAKESMSSEVTTEQENTHVLPYNLADTKNYKTIKIHNIVFIVFLVEIKNI